ncbi:MAG: hypothetical protein ACTHMM_12190 [Agriterribacter sp.]
MKFPVLIYKEKGDLKLYGYKDERVFKRTSRELLRAGVLDNEIAIDSVGTVYKFENIREVGYANNLWGFSFIRKGRQIIIDFDLIYVSQMSLEDVKSFVLKRLQKDRDNIINEVYEDIKAAKSIEQIINYFL